MRQRVEEAPETDDLSPRHTRHSRKNRALALAQRAPLGHRFYSDRLSIYFHRLAFNKLIKQSAVRELAMSTARSQFVNRTRGLLLIRLAATLSSGAAAVNTVIGETKEADVAGFRWLSSAFLLNLTNKCHS